MDIILSIQNKLQETSSYTAFNICGMSTQSLSAGTRPHKIHQPRLKGD